MPRLPKNSRPALSGGLVAALLAFAVGPIALGAQDQAPEGVVNYTRIDATVACAGLRPVAKALGESDSISNTFGMGRPANDACSRTMLYSSGSSLWVMARAWVMPKAIRSENQ